MNILITGGLGYIGSHLATVLHRKNNIILIDNLANSNISILNRINKICKKKILFYKCDVTNKKSLKKVLIKNKINLVIHLASLKSLEESYKFKNRYY